MRKKRKARELTVTAATQLTQNMQRVTLHGKDLADFPADAEGGYFKLVFPGENPDKPVLRTYTIAQYRSEKNEIDVDFMLHKSEDGSASGFAAAWATQAKIGDDMSIFGPSNASLINTDADWFVLASDMTGLPALTTNLKLLPADAKGHVVIEIIADEDKQNLPVPEGMTLTWVINPHPGSEDTPLYSSLVELTWLDAQAAVWTACEFKTMKKLRQYYREVRNVEKSHLYISSYWKKGLQEEEHKVVKREDAA